jgi:hypothetical protein
MSSQTAVPASSLREGQVFLHYGERREVVKMVHHGDVVEVSCVPVGQRKDGIERERISFGPDTEVEVPS